MCFSSPSPPATPTPAAAPPPPLPGATPEQLGTTAKAQNVAKYGSTDGPTTRVDRTTPDTSTTSGVNTTYRM